MIIIDSPECLAERFSVDLTIKKIHYNSLNQGRDHKNSVWGCLILQGELEGKVWGAGHSGFKNQGYLCSLLGH